VGWVKRVRVALRLPSMVALRLLHGSPAATNYPQGTDRRDLGNLLRADANSSDDAAEHRAANQTVSLSSAEDRCWAIAACYIARHVPNDRQFDFGRAAGPADNTLKNE
jgi:hypothetical protein